MVDLASEVPELQLRKRVSTRSIHKADLSKYPNNKVGDVIEIVSYKAPDGTIWTNLDVKYYIGLRDTAVQLKQPVAVLENV